MFFESSGYNLEQFTRGCHRFSSGFKNKLDKLKHWADQPMKYNDAIKESSICIEAYA